MPDTSVLRRWLELIEKSERGELPAADSAESDSLWTPEAEAEARRLIDAKTVKSATALQERLSINRQVSQELFRHITGKQKKKYHRE